MTIRSPSSHWAITLGLKFRRVNGAAMLFSAITCVGIFMRNDPRFRRGAVQACFVFVAMPPQVQKVPMISAFCRIIVRRNGSGTGLGWVVACDDEDVWEGD
jgi:hypothetical protein